MKHIRDNGLTDSTPGSPPPFCNDPPQDVRLPQKMGRIVRLGHWNACSERWAPHDEGASWQQQRL
jgi:hypothetical protein